MERETFASVLDQEIVFEALQEKVNVFAVQPVMASVGNVVGVTALVNDV